MSYMQNRVNKYAREIKTSVRRVGIHKGDSLDSNQKEPDLGNFFHVKNE
ncbi:MAG: hypothetical protein BWY09_02332 [Candidatus Hydrogenedentes bacterium ADurb.Bin179]|nr:MAG: hypothetical protein BWY09_02332 [Candidatus Hydrogenedentes bacterium ADurb.Bin179]